MKKELNLKNWNRKDHFEFFSKFDEPFFGLTVNINCTKAHAYTKSNGISFFIFYLYQALKAANTVEAFRYRIIDHKVYIFDSVNASPTVDRANGTFGFAYVDYVEDEKKFYKNAEKVFQKIKESEGLIPAISGENVIHFSAIPWLNFTSLSHARNFSFADSCPKISFGKLHQNGDEEFMPVSIHVNHALMDGYHVGLFVNEFQNLMNSK